MAIEGCQRTMRWTLKWDGLCENKEIKDNVGGSNCLSSNSLFNLCNCTLILSKPWTLLLIYDPGARIRQNGIFSIMNDPLVTSQEGINLKGWPNGWMTVDRHKPESQGSILPPLPGSYRQDVNLIKPLSCENNVLTEPCCCKIILKLLKCWWCWWFEARLTNGAVK